MLLTALEKHKDVSLLYQLIAKIFTYYYLQILHPLRMG